jgi:hypothetical protein
MIKSPPIGSRYRHLERDSTYTIVGTAYATIWDKFHGETYWLVVRKRKTSDVFQLMRQAKADMSTDVVLRLPVTMQKSKVREGQQATDFVIFQAESDNTLWAQSLEEFLDGRFLKIVK